MFGRVSLVLGPLLGKFLRPSQLLPQPKHTIATDSGCQSLPWQCDEMRAFHPWIKDLERLVTLLHLRNSDIHWCMVTGGSSDVFHLFCWPQIDPLHVGEGSVQFTLYEITSHRFVTPCDVTTNWREIGSSKSCHLPWQQTPWPIPSHCAMISLKFPITIQNSLSIFKLIPIKASHTFFLASLELSQYTTVK